jgi:hypothetical protein
MERNGTDQKDQRNSEEIELAERVNETLGSQHIRKEDLDADDYDEESMSVEAHLRAKNPPGQSS